MVGPFFLAFVQKRFFRTVNKHVPRVLEFAFFPSPVSLVLGGQLRFALRDGFVTLQYPSIFVVLGLACVLVLVLVHVFVEYMAIVLLKYVSVPDPFGDRGNMPLMAIWG